MEWRSRNKQPCIGDVLIDLTRCKRVKLSCRWGLSSTNMGQGVSIYVLDTGIRTSHQEFTQSGSNHMSRARQG